MHRVNADLGVATADFGHREINLPAIEEAGPRLGRRRQTFRERVVIGLDLGENIDEAFSARSVELVAFRVEEQIVAIAVQLEARQFATGAGVEDQQPRRRATGEEKPVARFIEAAAQRGLDLPGVFGVFYYRSANARTLNALKDFLPVPAEGLTREFGAGATAEEVCARTIRAAMEAGAKHFYISNLPPAGAPVVFASILERVGVAA